MMPRGRPQIKRLTGSGPAPSVALFTDSIDGDYHRPIVRGAVTAAFERGSNLLCFVGGHVMPAAGPHDHDWVYALAHPTNVDGIVSLSGAIVHSVGTQGFAEFCARYRTMPLCSAAIAVDGASSVCVDNEGGMRTLVEHLVRVHGLRHIAFVRGPRASDEAEMRLRAYRTVLDGAGIPYDPKLVADGDFLRTSGREAVKTLLAERGLTPGQAIQAVVACNDNMALGVMDELRQRGVRLPEDVAVAGFDDCAESRFASPPLTTVRQPLEEQGHEATRIVLEHIRNGGAAEQALRRTELVVRRSCGCLPAAAATSAGPVSAGLASSFDVAFLRGRQQAMAEMARAARGELGAAGPRWDSRLLSASSEQLRGDSPDAFTRAYDDMLRRLLQADTDVALCNDVLSAMRLRLVPYIADAATRTRAEDAFHEARRMTTTAVEGLYVGRRAQSGIASRALMRAGAAIAAARDVDELRRAVREELPALGVERCVLLRVDPTAGGDVARVVVAEQPATKGAEVPLAEASRATDALRSWVLREEDAHAFALFPVRFGGGERGLLALELGALEDSAYEALRLFFEAALRRMPLPPA